MGRVKCCYKCPDRWVSEGKTCHSTCKTYLEESAKVAAENEALRKDRQLRKYFYKNRG